MYTIVNANDFNTGYSKGLDCISRSVPEEQALALETNEDIIKGIQAAYYENLKKEFRDSVLKIDKSNLQTIKDASILARKIKAIYDSREEDIQNAAKELKDNTYLQFYYKLVPVLRRTKAAKEYDGTYESKFGNNILRINKVGSNLYIFVNGSAIAYKDGQIAPISQSENAIKILQRLVKSELEDKVSINRPEGRTHLKDIQELNSDKLRALGIKLPSNLNKKLKRDIDTGEELVSAKKGQLNKRKWLSSTDYNYGVKNNIIEPSDYTEYKDFYIKKKDLLELDSTFDINVYNPNEVIARTDKGEEFERLYDLGKPFLFKYKDIVYKVDKNSIKTL